MSTLVYKYTLKAPVGDLALLREEMEKSRTYRNDLVSVHRHERAALREVLLAVPAFAEALATAVAANARVAAAYAAGRAERAETGSRRNSEPLKAELEAAKEAYGASLKQMTLALKHATALESVKSEFERIRSIGLSMRKSARAYQAPWWGTYDVVERDMERSLRRVLAPGKTIPLPLWDGGDTQDPKFVQRAEYTHFVAVYVNEKNRSRTSDFVRISAPQWTSGARAEEKPKPILSVRIGTEGSKGARWAQWPMHHDRPLPADAEITNVKVTCTREARAERWHALITVRTNQALRIARGERRGELDVCGKGAVALDIGWRKFWDTFRAGYWYGDDGAHGEIRVDAALHSALTKADSLRSIRDRNFNEAKALFRAWLAARAIPPWLREATATLHIWQAPARLAALVLRWRAAPELQFEGSDEALLALELWRRQDAHLWHWECAQRNQALARRKNLYRIAAVKLSRQYGTLVLEKFDLRNVTRKQEEMSDVEELNTRAAGKLVACGELRSCMEQAFVRRGGTVVQVPAEHSTHTCPLCGVVTQFDAAASVVWTCSGCASEWDQDRSAAEVLLHRAQALRDTGHEPAAPAGKGEGKWARMRAKKKATVA